MGHKYQKLIEVTTFRIDFWNLLLPDKLLFYQLTRYYKAKINQYHIK